MNMKMLRYALSLPFWLTAMLIYFLGSPFEIVAKWICPEKEFP